MVCERRAGRQGDRGGVVSRYALSHRPDLGTFEFASLAILAGILAGLADGQLDWVAVSR